MSSAGTEAAHLSDFVDLAVGASEISSLTSDKDATVSMPIGTVVGTGGERSSSEVVDGAIDLADFFDSDEITFLRDMPDLCDDTDLPSLLNDEDCVELIDFDEDLLERLELAPVRTVGETESSSSATSESSVLIATIFHRQRGKS